MTNSFLDTNVVVYAFDRADPDRRKTAVGVLEGAERLVVSTQVLLETWWVLTRKLTVPLDEDRASEVVDQLSALPVVPADAELVRRAVDSARRFKVAIWDAMIIESARTGGCKRILSEDLQDGQDFDGVVVFNPFSA